MERTCYASQYNAKVPQPQKTCSILRPQRKAAKMIWELYLAWLKAVVGVKNTVTFREKTCDILRESYNSPREDEEEAQNRAILQIAAKTHQQTNNKIAPVIDGEDAVEGVGNNFEKTLWLMWMWEGGVKVNHRLCV